MKRKQTWIRAVGLAVAGSFMAFGPVSAAEESASGAVSQLGYALDNMMLLLAAVLVLFMQGGFAMVESGLNAAKNTANILFKNVMDLAVGVILFYLFGFGLMYPGDAFAGGLFGFAGFGISETSPAVAEPGTLHPQVAFLFQVAFAATAATIVSGAVAGRMRFGAYLIFSAVLTGFIYPISGMWKWGGGFLDAWEFHDFAGSVIVHAVGGFAGLAAAIVLGPRIGRFVNGKSVPMPGHNLAYAALGVVILWVGWYGFNPGSQLAFSTPGDVAAVVTVAVNTTLAAAAGSLAAMLLAWTLFKKPDLTMALNGVLAGLVGITANCDKVQNWEAIVIGGVAGVAVVGGILLLDRLRIDDPVGAWPVHGLCGIWGGLATGIFSDEVSFLTQLAGTAIICTWAFFTVFGLAWLLRSAGMLRVSPEEELEGLDLSEHGMHAYPPSLVAESQVFVEPVGSGRAMGAALAPAPKPATSN